MGVELGVGYLSIVPETRNFEKQLKAALAGRDVSVDVDADTKTATTHLDSWRSGQERKDIKLRVDIDTGRAASAVRSIRRDLDGLSAFKSGLKLNLGVLGLGSLPAMASGLTQVAAALQQVAQAALVIPGGIGGAVSSIGTLAVGLTGLKDAYDAVSTASGEAASSSGDQAASARSAMSASNSLRNAIVDETLARKDVTRATRDAQNALSDLRLEQRGGIVDEKRAVLEAQKAREDLYKWSPGDDMREKLLRVEEADQRVLEVRERNRQTAEELADANAKGVANSDQVVAANERLVRAQQGVAEAQASVADSAPKASAAQEKAAAAMAALSPAAQELVKTLIDLQPEFIGLRNAIAQPLLEGKADEFREFFSEMRPVVQKGGQQIAKAWNANITTLVNSISSDENKGLLDRILGNTAEAQQRFSKAIDPIVHALGVLTAAGSDSLPRLADAVGAVADRFNAFITAADEDGRLDKWIDEGLDGLTSLGNIVLNLGTSFTAVTKAAGGGAGLLGTLESASQKLSEFLNSTTGQEKLTQFFNEGREQLAQWAPILGNLVQILGGVYDAAKQWTDALLPALEKITGFLADHPKLISDVATAFIAWKSIQGVTSLITSLTSITTLLRTTLPAAAATGASGISAALAGIVIPPLIAELIDPGSTTNMGPDRFDPNKPSRTSNGQPQGWAGVLYGPSVGGWLNDVLGIDGSTQAPYVTGGARPGGPPSRPQNSLFGGGGLNPDAAQGYGLPTGSAISYGGSGFPDWVYQIADYFGIEPSTYSGHQETDRNEPGFAPNPNHQNRAIDWSGPVENMQRFADYVSGVGVEQVIWMNPSTGQQIGVAGGHQVGSDYYASDWGGHTDHVHTRQSMPIPLPGMADGGGVWGAGTSTSDSIPALLSNGEHVFTADDVAAMGGQGAVYNFRDALHRKNGGSIKLEDLGRTEGYIPAGAGATGKAGESAIAGAIDMGGQVINGLIDQAGQMASQAAAIGLAAGTMGAGAPAAPAAGAATDMLIGMGTQAAKRAVTWGFDMTGIGVDALLQGLTPFGMPRWLNADYTGFMPNWNIDLASAVSPMMSEELQKTLGSGGSGVDPNSLLHGQGAGQPPGPMGDPAAPGGKIGASGVPGPDLFQNQANSFLSTELAQTPEVYPGGQPVMFQMDNVYAANPEELGRTLTQRGNLAMMQHTGRPYP